MSGEGRNDGVFSEAAASRDGGAAGAGEIVAIGGGDTFDDAELAQAGEASGEGGGRALGEEWEEVGAPEAGDIESGTLEGRKQGLFGVAEEVETPDAAAFDRVRLGETVERPDTGREVVQTGEVFEVAAVATEQDVTEVSEAVDVLFDGSEGVACWTLLMFYLAVVLESGDVVGGGLDAQDEGEFVVDLDRGFAETMLDAGALDPGCELTADLLSELGSDLVAEEGGDVLGFDAEDGLPGSCSYRGLRTACERNTRSVAYSTCVKLQW